MELLIDDELRAICKAILAEKKTLAEWEAVEADDWFQSKHYVGGFDGDEKAFCFSAHLGDGPELWFQFSLDDAERIAAGDVEMVQAKSAG